MDQALAQPAVRTVAKFFLFYQDPQTPAIVDHAEYADPTRKDIGRK